jgi:hypothetical protein
MRNKLFNLTRHRKISRHVTSVSHLVAESTFFRLGARTLNCLGGLRHHNPNPNEPPNDERRKSWPYLEPRVLMFIIIIIIIILQ